MKIKITKKDILGFILLVTIVVQEFRISLQQHCPVEPPVSLETGFALNGTEYRSFTTASYASCLMECEADMSCMSLNFLMTTSTCDLNKHTKESQPQRYIERHNSIYSNNPAGRNVKKGMKELPGKSCLHILDSGGSVGSGVYWVDPANTGNPIQAFCDMTTDGGGWTKVARTVQVDTIVLTFENVDTYEVIAKFNVNDRSVTPTTEAMLDILQKMGFHQIHFYCHKKSVGRAVSIMTKNNTAGQQVVRYFTNDAFASTTLPDACGSFDTLPEDTSILAQNCLKWGKNESGFIEIGKWGWKGNSGLRRLVSLPFGMTQSRAFGYPNSGPLCDDDASPTIDINDTWQISVR